MSSNITLYKVLFVFVVAVVSVGLFALSQDRYFLLIGLAALIGFGLGLITDKR